MKENIENNEILETVEAFGEKEYKEVGAMLECIKSAEAEGKAEDVNYHKERLRKFVTALSGLAEMLPEGFNSSDIVSEYYTPAECRKIRTGTQMYCPLSGSGR